LHDRQAIPKNSNPRAGLLRFRKDAAINAQLKLAIKANFIVTKDSINAS
jgi:hypothetical protein